MSLPEPDCHQAHDATRDPDPSRLHFGLLGWGPQAPRQFGGVGLMIEKPGLELVAEPASEWRFEGPLADRVRELVGQVIDRRRTDRPDAPA